MAAGIVLMITLAISDHCQGLPMLAPLMEMQFEELIDAVAGDGHEYVTELAKIHYRNAKAISSQKSAQAMEEAASARKARNEEGITTDKETVFQAARNIADMIFEYANDDKIRLEDRRKESANPFYSQTRSGLYLEMYYGKPSTLWTPWGKWGFGGSGSGSWATIMPEILRRLGATVHIKKTNTENGTFGPVYAIHSFDGMVLPEPETCPRTEYFTYEVSKAEWNGLAEMFQVPASRY